MKSSTLFAVGFAVAWVALTPVTCRAQFEIAPDHFEVTNVEPISQTTNAPAVNVQPAQMRIGDEGRGDSNHNCASLKVPGRDKSKGVHVQFDLLGFAIVIGLCWYSASRPSKSVQAVERIWKQARVTLNAFSSGGQAKLPREALEPGP